jgi:hypothetical protein
LLNLWGHWMQEQWHLCLQRTRLNLPSLFERISSSYVA